MFLSFSVNIPLSLLFPISLYHKPTCSSVVPLKCPKGALFTQILSVHGIICLFGVECCCILEIFGILGNGLLTLPFRHPVSQGTGEDAQTLLVGSEIEQPLEETLDNMSEGLKMGTPFPQGFSFKNAITSSPPFQMHKRPLRAP